MSRGVFGWICLLAVSAVGCSGAHASLVAPDAKYPISLSDGVRDSTGRLVPDEELEVVGAFQSDFSTWGMWWNIISFTGDADISEDVNEQVNAAKGEGIVNLSVRSGNTVWNGFTLFGLLPDATTVKVRGHIVRRRKKVEAPPPPPVAAVAPPPAAAAPASEAPAAPAAPAVPAAPATGPETTGAPTTETPPPTPAAGAGGAAPGAASAAEPTP